jgi:hypothetical protein
LKADEAMKLGSSIAVVGIPIEISPKGWDFLTQVFANADKVAKPGSSDKTGKLDVSRIQSHVSKAQVFQ